MLGRRASGNGGSSRRSIGGKELTNGRISPMPDGGGMMGDEQELEMAAMVRSAYERDMDLYVCTY